MLTVRTSPIINAQPADITVSRDSDAVFSVRASGFTPLAFQWRYKGSDIPGATSSNLVLRNVQGRDEGAYSVAISNPIGTTSSRDAMLTVDDGLVTSIYETLLDVTNSWRYEASGQNLSFTLPDGSTLSFNVRVTGGTGTAYNAVAAPSWTGQVTCAP